MPKEINENQLKKQLIELYETYLIDKEDKNMQEKADLIYSNLLSAKSILNETLGEAVDFLSNLTGWGKELSEKTPIKELSREKVIEILKKLKEN